MTNTPDPLENPLAERMHRTLKEEFRLERGFPTFEQAQKAVARTIFIRVASTIIISTHMVA